MAMFPVDCGGWITSNRMQDGGSVHGGGPTNTVDTISMLGTIWRPCISSSYLKHGRLYVIEKVPR